MINRQWLVLNHICIDVNTFRRNKENWHKPNKINLIVSSNQWDILRELCGHYKYIILSLLLKIQAIKIKDIHVYLPAADVNILNQGNMNGYHES